MVSEQDRTGKFWTRAGIANGIMLSLITLIAGIAGGYASNLAKFKDLDTVDKLTAAEVKVLEDEKATIHKAIYEQLRDHEMRLRALEQNSAESLDLLRNIERSVRR